MINAIYGKKIGMTQLFDENDRVVPVTVIVAEPNKVCQVKTAATDGYEAVQLVFGAVKQYKSGDYKINKPMAGHFAKQGTEPTRYLREVRVENAGEYKVGDLQTVEAFPADTVHTSIVLPAPSASAQLRLASSRAFACRAIWAATL